MAYLGFQKIRRKKSYKEISPLKEKEHYNGIVETRELGERILSSWNVVEGIIPEERIGIDGKRRYYIPYMLEWSTQFTDKELLKLIKEGHEIEHYHREAFLRISEKIKNGEFIPAKKG